MAQQTIGIGTSANDGTGDKLRAAGTKINANFTELYAVAAGLGTASAQSIGTSGAAVPLLNASNTHSGDNTFSGDMIVAKRSRKTGVVSPSQITANQNDYNPASLASAGILLLNTDASRTVTGLAAQADGVEITIINSGSYDLVLSNYSGSSLAANRFVFGGSTLTLASLKAATFYYRPDADWWHLISTTGVIA